MMRMWSQLKEGWLEVGGGHEIYYAEYGDRAGVPVLSVHGGPGSRSKLRHLEYLPEGVRAILFDQRGCGLSRPLGRWEENETQDLIEDMERLRQHLGIERWLVVGSSWGATLALLYGERYRERVLGLGLRSVFLARKEDVEWGLSREGAGKFYPEGWKRLEDYAEERGFRLEEIVGYGWEVLTKGSEEEQKAFVGVIREWDWNVMQLEKWPRLVAEEVTEEEVAGMRIFWHYVRNGFFLRENQVLDDLEKLAEVPSVIVHGRYDMTCPPDQAWLVHQGLLRSELMFNTYSGHSLSVDGKIWFRKMLASLLLVV